MLPLDEESEARRAAMVESQWGSVAPGVVEYTEDVLFRDLWPGKSEEKKKELAERITEDVMRVLHYGEESVSVGMEEVAPEDWAERVHRPDIVQGAETLYKNPGYTM